MVKTIDAYKVLCVDDELDITIIIKKGLETRGFKVDAFNDSRQALQQFKPNYYDAIVLDVRMPRMNGFELAKAIWAQDPKAQICFLTAFEIYEKEAKKVFKDFKTHCFIRKPITINELASHIEKHLAAIK